MKRVILGLVGAAFLAVSASTMQAQSQPFVYTQAQLDQWPSWAYGWPAAPKPGEKAGPQAPAPHLPRPNEDLAEQLRMQNVPGSSAQYSLVQIRDGHNVIDWFPQDHPKMPNVIEHGPASLDEARGRGCASCHLPNGKGRPENANPAGQPANYIIQQMRDMSAGRRYTADPRKVNTPTMIALAKAMNEEELLESAKYFAAMPWTPWIRVVETDTIPESHLEAGNMYVPVHGSTKTEPLGNRIVESPEDEHQANMLRNIRSGWVAYVPKGSVARGRGLVNLGGARKTIACATCHGADLMGSGDFPGIAGRSPSYMMRQMWDMKVGTRDGLYADIMKPVLEKLTVDDMRDIVAYLATVPVPSAAPKPVTTARAAN